MKKIIFIVFTILNCICSDVSIAQNVGWGPSVGPQGDLNIQLRNMFHHISKPTNHPWFLYDYAVHLTDSNYFSNTNLTPTNFDVFWQQYKEFSWGAYDTLRLRPADSLALSSVMLTGDTVQIAIMDFESYAIKDTALNSNLYFNYDLDNDVFYDRNNRSDYPYDQFNTFTAVTCNLSNLPTRTIFKIDPRYIFTDFINQNYYSVNSTSYKLYIDFGDGRGEQIIDPSIISYYTINYPEEGGVIQIQYSLKNKDKAAKRASSSSTVITKANNATSSASPVILNNYKGIEVGYYEGCSARNVKRAIIYLEGIDPFDFAPRLGQDRKVLQISKNLDHLLLNINTDLYSVGELGNIYLNIEDSINYIIKCSTCVNDTLFVKSRKDGNVFKIWHIGKPLDNLVIRKSLIQFDENSGENFDLGHQNPTDFYTQYLTAADTLITYYIGLRNKNNPKQVN